jgi:hypothetical protein
MQRLLDDASVFDSLRLSRQLNRHLGLQLLEMNDVLTIADLTADGNYTFTNDPEEVVASILPPKQEAFEEDAEPSPGEEPEGSQAS